MYMATTIPDIWVQIGDERKQLEGQELSDYLADAKKTADEQTLAAEQIETAKIAAQAKLAALGLTADDLKALGL
jgi:hypothetical protein